MPYAAWTRESKFLAWVAMTEPWLKPATTMPFEQSALARLHSTLTALDAELGLNAQLVLPWITPQVLNVALSYAIVAATKPLAAICDTAADADALVEVSVVPMK